MDINHAKHAELHACQPDNVMNTTVKRESFPDALPVTFTSPAPAPTPVSPQAEVEMESDSETEGESDSNDCIDTIIRDITVLVAHLRRSRDAERVHRRKSEKDLARAQRRLALLDGHVRQALETAKRPLNTK